MRTTVTALATASVLAIALASPAGASAPLGECPLGGPGDGWMLVQATTPATIFVDTHGNNDGWACKAVFTNSGGVPGQVIDDRVQAPQ